MSLKLSRALLCGLLLASAAFAQTKPAEAKRSAFVQETEANWKRAKQWTLAYVDAMPEEHVNFKPTPEVRSFAEQMLHLTYWNYGLLEATGERPNSFGKDQADAEQRADLKTKAALRKAVADSYDYVLAVLAKLDEPKLLEEVKFFNRKMTRASVLAMSLDHQSHHRGQTTLYLRLKGITPPPEP